MIADDVRPYVHAAVKLLEKNNIDSAEQALHHINYLIGKKEAE